MSPTWITATISLALFSCAISRLTGQIAPNGALYLLRPVTITAPTGAIDVPAGSSVRFVSTAGDTFRVTQDGYTMVDLDRSVLTDNPELGRQIAAFYAGLPYLGQRYNIASKEYAEAYAAYLSGFPLASATASVRETTTNVEQVNPEVAAAIKQAEQQRHATLVRAQKQAEAQSAAAAAAERKKQARFEAQLREAEEMLRLQEAEDHARDARREWILEQEEAEEQERLAQALQAQQAQLRQRANQEVNQLEDQWFFDRQRLLNLSGPSYKNGIENDVRNARDPSVQNRFDQLTRDIDEARAHEDFRQLQRQAELPSLRGEKDPVKNPFLNQP